MANVVNTAAAAAAAAAENNDLTTRHVTGTFLQFVNTQTQDSRATWG